MVDKVRGSVVAIEAPDGTGTGFIVDKRGLIITNRHVVGAADVVKVKTVDEREFEGRVIRSDANVDYAIVMIDLPDAEPISWNEDPVREGMTVVAIGHPLGYDFTVTKGIVSSSKRVIHGVEYVQTDVPINPGNSGGPLLDEDGEVIGVNAWIRSDAQNIGFAIPVRYVRCVLEEIEPQLAEVESRYYCHVCGFLNESKGKYCKSCGVRIEEEPAADAERVCDGCKTPNPPGAKFCKSCGAPLETKK
ncbi:MAG: trypsin-like peptidase domain-containing protein [Candidatus Zixiibacteriota bacterium]|jgi:serine protease Do